MAKQGQYPSSVSSQAASVAKQRHWPSSVIGQAASVAKQGDLIEWFTDHWQHLIGKQIPLRSRLPLIRKQDWAVMKTHRLTQFSLQQSPMHQSISIASIFTTKISTAPISTSSISMHCINQYWTDLQCANRNQSREPMPCKYSSTPGKRVNYGGVRQVLCWL